MNSAATDAILATGACDLRDPASLLRCGGQYAGVMVLLGTIPEVPAPRLIALADRLENAARDIAREARDPFDRGLRRVAESLAMLSIAVRRMSESGPRAHLESLRQAFPEHYEDSPGEQDPLAGHRARLDVISFLAVGDMVLDDAATMVLERDRVAPGDYPWRTYMRRIDAAALDPPAPMVRAARQLDLMLREARHRLVAHRLAHHVSMFAWASDGTQEVDLVNPDGVEPAYRLLIEVTERLGIAHSPPEEVTPTEYYALLRPILSRAGELDEESRSVIRRAFREAGYGFAAAVGIVDTLLALVREARAHGRAT